MKRRGKRRIKGRCKEEKKIKVKLIRGILEDKEEGRSIRGRRGQKSEVGKKRRK